jgi:hypothetical protein
MGGDAPRDIGFHGVCLLDGGVTGDCEKPD